MALAQLEENTPPLSLSLTHNQGTHTSTDSNHISIHTLHEHTHIIQNQNSPGTCEGQTNGEIVRSTSCETWRMVLTCENSGWLKSSVLVREVPLFATLKLPHLFNALTVTYSLFIWFKAPTVVSLEKNPPPPVIERFLCSSKCKCSYLSLYGKEKVKTQVTFSVPWFQRYIHLEREEKEAAGPVIGTKVFTHLQQRNGGGGKKQHKCALQKEQNGSTAGGEGKANLFTRSLK